MIDDDQHDTLPWFAAVVLCVAFAAFIVLLFVNNPEPALPRCPTDRVAHERCQP